MVKLLGFWLSIAYIAYRCHPYIESLPTLWCKRFCCQLGILFLFECAFMISKTHVTAQKPCGRQLNANMVGRQRYLENGSSTHRHFITTLMLITMQSFITTQCLHSYEFILVNKTVLSSAQLLSRRTPFSNVRMRICSLVPKPKTTVIAWKQRSTYWQSLIPTSFSHYSWIVHESYFVAIFDSYTQCTHPYKTHAMHMLLDRTHDSIITTWMGTDSALKDAV